MSHPGQSPQEPDVIEVSFKQQDRNKHNGIPRHALASGLLQVTTQLLDSTTDVGY